MNTADNSGYIKGQLTIHYTKNVPGTPCKKVRTICGQAFQKSYFMVHGTPQTVNCLKCLAHG